MTVPLPLPSLASAVLLACAATHLLGQLHPARGVASVMLIPAIGLGLLAGPGATLATAAGLMTLAAASAGRHGMMLAWIGVAIGLDPHAALLAPFVLALLIRGEVPIAWWPIALAAGIAAGWAVPPDFPGSPAQPDLSALAATLFGVDRLALVGLALTLAIGLAAAYTAWASSRIFGARALLEAALLSPLVAGLLLPQAAALPALAMLLAGIIAVRWPDWRSITLALLVHASAALALGAAPSGTGPYAILAVTTATWASLRLAIPLLRPAANDDPVMPRLALPH